MSSHGTRADSTARLAADHGMICSVTPPVYLPMLAESDAGELQGEWAAEPKLDGWRAIVTVDSTLPVGFEVRSRTGRFITTHVPRPTTVAERDTRAHLE